MSDRTLAKIYTRDQLRTALRLALDNAPEFGPQDECKIIFPEYMDYYADLIYDNAGAETDISPLLEKE